MECRERAKEGEEGGKRGGEKKGIGMEWCPFVSAWVHNRKPTVGLVGDINQMLHGAHQQNVGSAMLTANGRG